MSITLRLALLRLRGVLLWRHPLGRLVARGRWAALDGLLAEMDGRDGA